MFPLTVDSTEEFQEREVIEGSVKEKANTRARYQLEMPGRKGGHRRSRSDMVDSICVVDKWIEYEKRREMDIGQRAPIAEPESVCNISTLHLENQGKFITNRDFAVLKTDHDDNGYLNVENGPVLQLPFDKQRKTEKKSTVGGFFSKLGRAVLKPRNFSDGDQYTTQKGNLPKERKKSFSLDKENINTEQVGAFEKGGVRDSKRFKSDGNKVSRFFQRGGLYRSSKMKKKNQNNAAPAAQAV